MNISQTMTFGDDLNDVAMLTAAGIGRLVKIENRKGSVKK